MVIISSYNFNHYLLLWLANTEQLAFDEQGCLKKLCIDNLESSATNYAQGTMNYIFFKKELKM